MASGSSSSHSSKHSSGGFLTGDQLIVFWMSMSFLAIVLLLSLFAVPRFVSRVWRRADFRQSHVLSSRALSTKATPSSSTSTTTYFPDAPELSREKEDTPPVSPVEKKSGSSESVDNSAVVNSHMDTFSRASAPLHIPSYSTLLHPISSPFLWSPTNGLSGSRIVIFTALLAVVILVIFIAGGDPFSSPKRVGWVATAFLPFTVALGTKNNIIGVLIGVGYEKLNFLHRWLGIASFATANLHMILYIAKWSLTSSTNLTGHFAKKSNIYGLCSLMGLELLFFASLPFVRNRFYTAFLFSHIIGIFLFFVCLYYHTNKSLNWIIAGAAVWAFDHALRIFKTRLAVARVSSIPSLGFTRMEIPSIKSGWRAGQHVRIRVISSTMGLFGWTVAHPFTVANVPGMCGDSGMVLFIKKSGAWTNGLYNIASQAESLNEQGIREKEVRVVVEGPYSGLGNMVTSSFTSALLIGGGSGVTLPLGQAEEIVRDILQGKSSIRFIEVIWITQDEYSIRAMLPAFTSILDDLPSSFGVSMRISIYYTRASPVPAVERDSAESTLPSGLTISAGRPPLSAVLDALARAATSTQSARGVAVCVCGPKKLIHDVKQCARSIDPSLRRSCGGIEVHDEFFGW